MRFMVIVKANRDSEAGAQPTTELLEEMTRFNEELVSSGVMVSGEGLLASSKGARIRFSGQDRSVTRGPFPLSDDLVAGFWIIQTSSLDEAIEVFKRCPNPGGGESELEIRQVAEADDFGEEMTPELRKREDRMRDQLTTH